MTVVGKGKMCSEDDDWWEELGSYKETDKSTDKKKKKKTERYSIATDPGTDDRDFFQDEVMNLHAAVSSLEETVKTVVLSLGMDRDRSIDKPSGSDSKPTKSVHDSMNRVIEEMKKASITGKKKPYNKRATKYDDESSSDSESDSSESNSDTSSDDSNWKRNKTKQKKKVTKSPQRGRSSTRNERKETPSKKNRDSSSDSNSSEERKPINKGKSKKSKEKEKKPKEETGAASSSTDPLQPVFHVNVTPVIAERNRGRERMHQVSVVREPSSSLSSDTRQSDRAIEQLSFSEMDVMTKACMHHLRYIMRGEWVSFLFLCRLKPFMAKYSIGQVRAAFESSVSKSGRPRFQISADGRSVRLHPETEWRR